MHRRILILITTLAIAVIAGVVLAAPVIQQPVAYLPSVQYQPPPTATPVPPTPIPEAIEILVIQPSEMRSGYDIDDEHIVTNAEAAVGYPNQSAALQAFQAQGRETSIFIDYFSTDYVFFDAVAVADQVYRYLTPAGAEAGQAYNIAETRRDKPDFQPFPFSFTCCPTLSFHRTFAASGLNYEQYLFSMRVGRYLADVQIIALEGSITTEQAVAYAGIGLNHLVLTPQLASAAIQSVPSTDPRVARLREELIVR